MERVARLAVVDCRGARAKWNAAGQLWHHFGAGSTSHAQTRRFPLCRIHSCSTATLGTRSWLHPPFCKQGLHLILGCALATSSLIYKFDARGAPGKECGARHPARARKNEVQVVVLLAYCKESRQMGAGLEKMWLSSRKNVAVTHLQFEEGMWGWTARCQAMARAVTVVGISGQREREGLEGGEGYEGIKAEGQGKRQTRTESFGSSCCGVQRRDIAGGPFVIGTGHPIQTGGHAIQEHRQMRKRDSEKVPKARLHDGAAGAARRGALASPAAPPPLHLPSAGCGAARESGCTVVPHLYFAFRLAVGAGISRGKLAICQLGPCCARRSRPSRPRGRRRPASRHSTHRLLAPRAGRHGRHSCCCACCCCRWRPVRRWCGRQAWGRHGCQHGVRSSLIGRGQRIAGRWGPG